MKMIGKHEKNQFTVNKNHLKKQTNSTCIDEMKCILFEYIG